MKVQHKEKFEVQGISKYYASAVSVNRKKTNEARKKLEDINVKKELERSSYDLGRSNV